MLAFSLLSVFVTLVPLQVSLRGFSLAPRDVGALANSLPSIATDVGTGTSAGEVEFSTIVQGWSAVPWAFSKCRSTFEQRPPAKLAIQAINTLESSIKIVVAKHSSCKLCRSLGTQSTYYVEFEQITRQIFVSWQSVLLDGSQKYLQEWKTTIGLSFKTFTSFLTTIYNMCLSLQIDLSAIFRSIHLNYRLFSEVGLDLVQTLKLNIGVSTTAQLPHASTQVSTSNGKQPQSNPRGNLSAPATPVNMTLPHGSLQSSTSNQMQPPSHSTSLSTLPSNSNNLSGLVISASRNPGQASIQSGGQALVTIVQAWSALPISFAKCKAVFEQKASASLALQAVGTLHATVQSAVSRYGTCKSCNSLNVQDAFYKEFQKVLREIFTVWQSLLLIGEQQYKAEWNSFKAQFAKFDLLLVAVHDISSSIKLDLRWLLGAIPLKIELFLSAGLNLSSRLSIPQPSASISGVVSQGPKPIVPLQDQVNSQAGASTGTFTPGTTAIVKGTGSSAAANDTGEKGLTTIVQGWSTLPKAFAECQSAFVKGVSINLAIKAVVTLHAAVQSAISQYATCVSCTDLPANSPALAGFRGLLAQIFISWQSVLEIGQRTYRLPWKSSVAIEFKKFSSFWAVIKSLSASVRLNLDVFFSSIHLKTSAFADIGIDLTSQIHAAVSSDLQAVHTSSAKTPAHDISAVVYGWSTLPSAFIKCQSTLETRASITVAFQAIATLHATLQATTLTYGSCNSCGETHPHSALAIRFRGIISQIFISWQKLIHIAKTNYGPQWNVISVEFKQFSSFLVSVKDSCSSLKINLGALFGEIHIDTDLFADVGLNLHTQLNLNLGGHIGGGRCTGSFLGFGFHNCLLDGPSSPDLRQIV